MRHTIALISIIILLFGCRDKIVCPAFQSAYILDDSVRNVYYSYLWKIDKEERNKYLYGANEGGGGREWSIQTSNTDIGKIRKPESKPTLTDSSEVAEGVTEEANDYFAYVEPYVGSPEKVNKNKFGIIRYEPYLWKNYKLMSAPKENLLAPTPEKEKEPKERKKKLDKDSLAALRDSVQVVRDSAEVLVDTAQAIAANIDELDTGAFELPKIAQPKPPEFIKETTYLYRYDPKDSLLNVEQEYYNWYFGEQLVRVREIPTHPVAPEEKKTFWEKVKEFFKFQWISNKREDSDDDDATSEFGEDDFASEGEEEKSKETPVEGPLEEGTEEEDPGEDF